MTAPDKIWTAPTDGKCHVGFDTKSMNYTIEYTRTDLAQAAVAAAYEAAAEMISEYPHFMLMTPDQKKVCVHLAQVIRALATADQIAALAAELAATVTVNPLVWVKSHMTPWRDDWHTVPTAYTIRCCDENGWKWQGNGGHGYESSAKHAMTAVQGIHEAAIRSAITITSEDAEITRLRAVIAKGAAQMIDDQHKMHKAVEAAQSLRNAVQVMRVHPAGVLTEVHRACEEFDAVLAEIGGA